MENENSCNFGPGRNPLFVTLLIRPAEDGDTVSIQPQLLPTFLGQNPGKLPVPVSANSPIKAHAEQISPF